MALTAKLVARSGTWFRYGDLQLGQGREKAKDYLRENPNLTEELRQKILEMGSTVAAVAGGGDAAE
jgi:recombination protein RecA